MWKRTVGTGHDAALGAVGVDCMPARVGLPSGGSCIIPVNRVKDSHVLDETDNRPPKTEADRKVAERVADHLAAIPDLYTLLGMFRTAGSAPPDPDARQGTTNPSRPTVRLEVVDLTDERYKPNSDDPGFRDLELDKLAGQRRLGVLPTLSLWVMLADSEMRDQSINVVASPEPPTIAGECGWLTKHLGWILEHHPDFAEDVKWMHRDLQSAVGLTPDKPIPCRYCKGRVEPQDGGTWFLCLDCGKNWLLAAELVRIGAEASNARTLKQIARELDTPVPLKTLHHWNSKGWIAPIGKGPRGFLFDIKMVERFQQTSDRIRQPGKQ